MTKKDQIYHDVDVDELDDEELEEDEEEENEEEDQEEDEEENEESDDDEEEENEDEEDAPANRKTVSIDEYKQLQREATKGVKKVLDQNKMLKETFTLLPEIAEDPEKLLSVHEKNPDQAQLILESYYWGISIEEFAQQELGKSYKPKAPQKSEEDIRQEERQKMNDEQINAHIEKLVKKSWLSDKQERKLREEYEELIEGKKLTIEKAQKYFQIAYNLVRKTPKDDPSTRQIKKTAPWGWTWGDKPSKKEDPYLTEAKKFLDEHWLY